VNFTEARDNRHYTFAHAFRFCRWAGKIVCMKMQNNYTKQLLHSEKVF